MRQSKNRHNHLVKLIAIAGCIALFAGVISPALAAPAQTEAASASSAVDNAVSEQNGTAADTAGQSTTDEDTGSAIQAEDQEAPDAAPAYRENDEGDGSAVETSGGAGDTQPTDVSGASDATEVVQKKAVEQVVKKDAAEAVTGKKDEALTFKASATTKETLDGDYQYISRASISGVATGTAPFDGDNNPGNDAGADNNIVRTYDSLNYTVSVVSKGYDTTLSFKSGYTWYRFVVPGSESAQSLITGGMSDSEKAAILSAEMEIDTSSMGWMTSGTGTDYDFTTKIEQVD